MPFWYSRFPALTSDQIRNNALIHSGASLARSATECEEWTRCFGSMPRVENRIETDEVQALVFRGMKRLPYSTALALRLPPDPEGLGEWLSWVRGRPMQLAQQADPAQFAALIDEGVLLPVPRPAGQVAEYALAHSLTLTFGDRPLAGDSLSEVDVLSSAPVYPRRRSRPRGCRVGQRAGGVPGPVRARHGAVRSAECRRRRADRRVPLCLPHGHGRARQDQRRFRPRCPGQLALAG